MDFVQLIGSFTLPEGVSFFLSFAMLVLKNLFIIYALYCFDGFEFQCETQILEYGENKLVYVPDLHEFGDEVIKFAVNDCPFDRFRQSPETNINIWIEPVDDPPIAVDFSVVHNVRKKL